MPAQVKRIPEGYPVVTPYLIVHDAAAAIAFYKQIFGARERMRMAMPGGRVGHAELDIGGSVVMLADEFPDMGARAPGAYNGSPVSLHLYVDDADKTVRQAEAAGAKIVHPVDTKFYGDRGGAITDPFGHTWHIATHVEDVPPDEIEKRALALFGSKAS